MKKFGLIGYPIKGSLSPTLFRAGYGGKYPYDLIENADLEAAYRKFLDEYDGVNITAPYKEDAFRKADIIDPVCQRIGATNLTVKTPEGIHAYNSDYIGIRRSLIETALGCIPEDETDINAGITDFFGHRPDALVVGCGGAGKAAAVAAAGLGMKTCLMNRTAARAEKIALELPEYGFYVKPLDDFMQMFMKCDVIIYTLPESIQGIQALESGELPPQKDTGKKIILEANYKTPAFSPEAMSRLQKTCPGIRYVSGLRWLLHQAAGGYELFTGEVPDFRAMEKAITPGL